MSNQRLGSGLDFGLIGFYVICTGVLAFILLPIITIFAYSLVGSFDGGFISSLTFEYYRAALRNNSDPFLMSIQIAFVTTLIDILIGVPAGYILVKYNFRFNDLLRELTILPMAIPGIVIGIGVVRVWGTPRLGIDLAGTTVLIVAVHALFTMPFIIQTTMSTLESINFRQLEESAQSLGAGWIQLFTRVILPNIYNGILAGAVMVFALSMGEFNITFFVYSPLNTTLPIALFGGFRTATVGEASALASLFIGIVLVSIVCLQALSDTTVRSSGGNI
jgi:putative spermidine/putrescine transport system permease protein